MTAKTLKKTAEKGKDKRTIDHHIAQTIKDNSPSKTPEPKSDYFIFFSFDLVKSTKLKSSEPEKWASIIGKFYKEIEDTIKMQEGMTSTKLWKYIGDEITFYLQVTDKAQINQSVHAADTAMKQTLDLIIREHKQVKTYLSIKCTVWCGRCSYKKDSVLKEDEKKLNNIAIKPSLNRLDFIGQDIDTGFRLAKYTTNKIIALSAEMAYLLRKLDPKIESDIKIVGYQKLKGIWDNHHYPIIWYLKDWENKRKNHFMYDVRFDNTIVKNVIEDHNIHSIDEIDRILNDMNRMSQIKSDLKEIESLSGEHSGEHIDQFKSEVSQDRLAEVHCVAVCLNNEGEILAAKRPESKRRFPNYWEFGCGQLYLNEDFIDCLKRSYKEDFNAEFDLGFPLSPIGTFRFTDDDKRLIPGIISVAKVSNQNEISKTKHTEIKWLLRESWEQELAGQPKVEGFEDRLKKAWEVWEKFNKK